MRTVGPYVSCNIAVVPGIKNQMCVRVADAVGIVDDEVVGVIFIIGQTGNGSPKVALTVVVLVFHEISGVDLVVVP